MIAGYRSPRATCISAYHPTDAEWVSHVAAQAREPVSRYQSARESGSSSDTDHVTDLHPALGFLSVGLGQQLLQLAHNGTQLASWTFDGASPLGLAVDPSAAGSLLVTTWLLHCCVCRSLTARCCRTYCRNRRPSSQSHQRQRGQRVSHHSGGQRRRLRVEVQCQWRPALHLLRLLAPHGPSQRARLRLTRSAAAAQLRHGYSGRLYQCHQPVQLHRQPRAASARCHGRVLEPERGRSGQHVQPTAVAQQAERAARQVLTVWRAAVHLPTPCVSVRVRFGRGSRSLYGADLCAGRWRQRALPTVSERQPARPSTPSLGRRTSTR